MTTPAPKELKLNLAKKKYGHYLPAPILFYPPGFHASALNAVRVAEKEKGRSVYVCEVAQVHDRISWFPTIPGMLNGSLYELFRNDEVLSDREAARFSVNPAI